MTSYSPTLLPPSPPFATLDDIIIALCDRCLVVTDNPHLPSSYKQQMFDLTMALVDFWETELDGEHFREL